MQMGNLGNENRDLQRGSPGSPGKAGEGSTEKEHGCSQPTGAKPSPSPCPRDPHGHAAVTDCHGSWLFPHVVQFPQKQAPN